MSKKQKKREIEREIMERDCRGSQEREYRDEGDEGDETEPGDTL